MTSLTSRLIQSRTSLFKSYTIAASRNGRYLSTDSNKIDEPFKVEEAETVNVPPPLTEKPMQLLVLGGNGFVGSHICKEAVDRGLTVASLSRSGRPPIHDSWVNNVIWHQGSLLSSDSWMEALNGVTSVVVLAHSLICIRLMELQILMQLELLLKKKAAETELLTKFAYGGVILRPGFIHGTRNVGSVKLPLGVIGSPLEMVLQHAKPLKQLPLVGPLFTPPVSATAVAKVAVRAATDPVFPPGIVDVYGILRYSQQRAT
uniref:NAD-dependent epimerase/dehydratase domain-containing protein n=1 Tax=Salix viminalis TaxID=40686 RepID=A0A6N2LUP5_SALVM